MDWLARPSDNRVLIATSILLDGRVVYGPTSGLDVKQLLFETGDRSTLERWMLRLALAAKPPTGFMHDIVVEDTGERKGTFDIKHGGLLPVVDLARYAALRAGVRVTPTIERLRAATDEGVLRPTEARILEEAFDLFSALRLEHQVSQLERDLRPDDHLDPRTSTRSPGDICATPSGRSPPCSGHSRASSRGASRWVAPRHRRQPRTRRRRCPLRAPRGGR